MAGFDMVVLVPKADELATLERFFDADFSIPAMELSVVDLPVYSMRVAGLRVGVVALGGQGNAAARSVTDHVIVQLDARLLVLLGTALGNSRRCTLGSVVVASMVHDLTERRVTDDGVSFRGTTYEVAGRLRREIGRFCNFYDARQIRDTVRGFVQGHSMSGLEEVIDDIGVEFEHVCAGTDLIEGRFQESIWNRDDRIACYDMESAGFAASANQHNGVLWMIIRGVSDHGDQARAPATKKARGLRTLSTAAAAAFLRDFLTHGLKSCHPRTLHPPTSPDQRLSPRQFYSGVDGFEWFRGQLTERFGMRVPSGPLGRDLTLEGFAAICQSGASVESGWLRDALFKLREEYFEEGYLDYTYGQDIRGFIPGWSEEFHDVLRRGTIRLEVTEVLDVGCGNGLELEPLFKGAKTLTAVDISRPMLDRAAERFHGIRTVHACAEDLRGVEDSSVDLYVSLRTYMSRFFDRQAAILEAYRVLRPGRLAVISIANGYLDTDSRGEPRVVRGLRVPARDGWVDPEEPFRIESQVRRQLTDMGFEKIERMQFATDAYVWATKPQE